MTASAFTHLRALAVLIPDLERRGLAALGLELVEAGAADAGDAARCVDVVREAGLGRERLEVALNQFGAGRILVRIRGVPSGRREQARGRPVDVVFPRREQLHVAPLAHRMPDAVAGLQHDRPEAALQHMGGGGKADRAGADDGDGLGFAHRIVLPSY